jgi:DNA replication protein DnaC
MSKCPFDLCDGDGMIVDEATNTAYDCKCRPLMKAQRRARGLSAVIPRRYEEYSFDRHPVTEMNGQVVRTTRRFADTIDQQLDDGRGLWFMGGVGNGKTVLAMLVSRAALNANRSVVRFPLPELLVKIRRTFETGSHEDLFSRLTSVDLLHLDDIGAEQTTPWVLEELYSIVNARYENQRSMVITTNITDYEELCRQISQRTVSRLAEMCEQLLVPGEDHRMEHRQSAPAP